MKSAGEQTNTAALKPAPLTTTAVPATPEMGLGRICGTTKKLVIGGAESSAGDPCTVRLKPPVRNVDPAPTTNDRERTPVLPVTVHRKLETMRDAAGGGVKLHPVSLGAKPVPEMETVVPAAEVPEIGGEPWNTPSTIRLTAVTNGVTAKVGPSDADGSPWEPVTITR